MRGLPTSRRECRWLTGYSLPRCRHLKYHVESDTSLTLRTFGVSESGYFENTPLAVRAERAPKSGGPKLWPSI
jgi:hypothetical protein